MRAKFKLLVEQRVLRLGNQIHYHVGFAVLQRVIRDDKNYRQGSCVYIRTLPLFGH